MTWKLSSVGFGPRVELLEFDARLARSELPIYGRAARIALGLQGKNPLLQGCSVGHGPRQAAALDGADLNLRLVESTAMFGGVVERQAGSLVRHLSR